MKARISQLHKTEAEWSKLPDFAPLQGELVIFDPDEQHKRARLKIGDGSTALKDLPFFIDASMEDITAGLSDKVLDAGRVFSYKK